MAFPDRGRASHLPRRYRLFLPAGPTGRRALSFGERKDDDRARSRERSRGQGQSGRRLLWERRAGPSDLCSRARLFRLFFHVLPVLPHETFGDLGIVMGLYLVPTGALMAQPRLTAMFLAMTANFVPLLRTGLGQVRVRRVSENSLQTGNLSGNSSKPRRNQNLDALPGYWT